MAQSIAIGDLRHSILIRNFTTAQSSSGQINKTWGTLATVWAKVEMATGRDLIGAQTIVPSTVLRVTIRHRTDVTSDLRLQINSEDYNILGEPQDLDGRKMWLQILCSKVVD